MPAKTDVVDYALRYIYRYPKTEKELILQLRKKWYTESEIEKTILYLKKKKYLNDKNFVKDYVDYHLVRRWKPIIYVKNKLFEKWVDSNIVKEVISDKFDEINKWIEKQLKKEIETYKAKWLDGIDIIQRLNRKGYTLNQIKHIINNN